MEAHVCLPLEPTQGDQRSNSDELVHPRGGGGSEDVRGEIRRSLTGRHHINIYILLICCYQIQFLVYILL